MLFKNYEIYLVYFIGHGCIFPLFFLHVITVARMYSLVANRTQPDSLLSYLPKERTEMVAFCIGSLSIQSLVNRILCLVPPKP